MLNGLAAALAAVAAVSKSLRRTEDREPSMAHGGAAVAAVSKSLRRSTARISENSRRPSRSRRCFKEPEADGHSREALRFW